MEFTGTRLPTYWLPDHNEYDHGSNRFLRMQDGAWIEKPSKPSDATIPPKPHLLAEQDLQRSTLDIYNELVQEDEDQRRAESRRTLLPSFRQPPRISLPGLLLSKVQSLLYTVSLTYEFNLLHSLLKTHSNFAIQSY